MYVSDVFTSGDTESTAIVFEFLRLEIEDSSEQSSNAQIHPIQQMPAVTDKL